MSSNNNSGYSGNYSNRPREDISNYGKNTGQSNYSGGFSNMDSQKQQDFSSTGNQTSGGGFKQSDPRTRQAGQKGGSRTSGSGYNNLNEQDFDYPEE